MTASAQTCPDWCQLDFPAHREDFDAVDPIDGLPQRIHAIEFDNVEAKTDRFVKGAHPSVFVCVSRSDKSYGGHMVTGPVRIKVALDGEFPAFTVPEARELIATLQRAVERATEIGG